MKGIETVSLHPEYITKNGKKEFVVLPYDEFNALQEALEDAQDLLDLRKAKRLSKGKTSVSLDEAKKLLGV